MLLHSVQQELSEQVVREENSFPGRRKCGVTNVWSESNPICEKERWCAGVTNPRFCCVKSSAAIMSQGGSAAIREAIEAKRSKIKTPGVSLKTLERDAKRKKAWYEGREEAGARDESAVRGREEVLRVGGWVTFEETALFVSYHVAAVQL